MVFNTTSTLTANYSLVTSPSGGSLAYNQTSSITPNNNGVANIFLNNLRAELFLQSLYVEVTIDGNKGVKRENLSVSPYSWVSYIAKNLSLDNDLDLKGYNIINFGLISLGWNNITAIPFLYTNFEQNFTEIKNNLNSNISSLNASVIALNSSLSNKLERAVQNGSDVSLANVSITRNLTVKGDINLSGFINCNKITGSNDDFCADADSGASFDDSGITANTTALSGRITGLNLTAVRNSTDIIFANVSISRNLTLIGDLNFTTNITGMSCLNIRGGTDANYCVDDSSSFNDAGITANTTALSGRITGLNLTAVRNNTDTIFKGTNATNSGATTFYGNLACGYITGSTGNLCTIIAFSDVGIIGNTTALSERITGLNLTANRNSTDVIFANVSIIRNITLNGDLNFTTNLTGINCLNVKGGTDSDYCADASSSFSDDGITKNITTLNSTVMEFQPNFELNFTELWRNLNSNITSLNSSVASKLSFAVQNNTEVVFNNLTILGNASFGINITFKKYFSCNLETDSNGFLICGVDDSSSFNDAGITANTTALSGRITGLNITANRNNTDAVFTSLNATNSLKIVGSFNISSNAARHCFSNATCALICVSTTSEFAVCD